MKLWYPFITLSLCLSLNAAEKLTLTGSSTLAPLISEIGKLFEKSNKVRINVQTGGSARGIADARRGLADIGMASRELKPTEDDVKSHTIAWDGVGLLVHASNPVQGLSRKQFQEIFTGKVTNWKTLGGNDAKIVVVNRAEGRSEVELITKFLQIRTSEIKAALIVGENAHGIKTIARNPNALTFLSIGHTLKEAELGVPVKILALDGIEGTAETVSQGTYPLARPLNLITKSRPQGLAQTFIQFAKSPKVNAIVTEQSFVPVK